MNTLKYKLVLILMFTIISYPIYSQTTSASDNLVAQPIADRVVTFDLAAAGDTFPYFKFGFDTAWDWEENVIICSRFMEKPFIDVVRVSYQPENDDLVDGDLAQSQIDKLNWRLSLVQNYANPNREVVMNVAADPNTGPYVGNATKWKDLVKATAIRIENAGHTVVSVGPMNEPDYSTWQGDINDFYNIVTAMRDDTYFDGIRISAGNTLNCDPNPAADWYNYMLPAGADEGNTHQLAGGFNGYAYFHELVNSNGDFSSNDEMHNIVEAIVGQEYGAQMGIWWGEAELARGELGRAMNHPRIGYAEHRSNWTAAAVYKVSDNNAKAFGGTSERQAVPTTYNYVSKDRVVYYDGQGPMRDFVLELPGDPQGDYWSEQTNAERVINVTWGEDVQPYINGRYKLVNENSGLVMETAGTTVFSDVRQAAYTGSLSQQWDVNPVKARVGGDFSYYELRPASNTSMALDLDYSSNGGFGNGNNIWIWNRKIDDTPNTNNDSRNQQWYLEYAGDGWFWIRSRRSSSCVDVFGASTSPGGTIAQWEKNIPETGNQKWRFLPVDAPIEFVAPSAPTNLNATANSTSVELSWIASPESDVAGYLILRSETPSGPYNTIARYVTDTSFIDNTTLSGVEYFYVIKAVDGSLNHSPYSNEASAIPTGTNESGVHYQFEGNTLDSTINLNHCAPFEAISYDAGPEGSQSVVLGGNSFLQLPPDVANRQDITIATWVYWNGGSNSQRIFDFGNGDEETMYLSPKGATSQLYFGIKNGGAEQSMASSPALASGEWIHLAITLDASGGKFYRNGLLIAQNPGITISPLDFKPVLNYIGRSQNPLHPFFNGKIDDFRMYNYALTPTEIGQLAGILSLDEIGLDRMISIWPVPTNDILNITATNTRLKEFSIYDLNGRVVMQDKLQGGTNNQINVSYLPSGIYFMKVINDNHEAITKKVVVRH